MKTLLCYEDGYITAMFGIGLSYGLTSNMSVSEFRSCKDKALLERLQKIALMLSKEGGGEDKFLRQMIVCLDISAPRYWWTQMDTYKVGTVAQSESTMHTIAKQEFSRQNFSISANSSELDFVIDKLNELKAAGKFAEMIKLLPQSFIQRRIWTANYAVLKNIFEKRATHKLLEWHVFIQSVRRQIAHPEFLPCKTQSTGLNK